MTDRWTPLFALTWTRVLEFVREPDAHLGTLYGGFATMGMLLSLPMVLIGLIAIYIAAQRGPTR